MTEHHSVEDRLRRTLRAISDQPIPPAPPTFDPHVSTTRHPVRIIGAAVTVAAVAAAVSLALLFGPHSDNGVGRAHRITPATSPPSATVVVPSTTTLPTTTSGIVLEADGLGVVETGDAQAKAVRTLSSHLGAPTTTTTGLATGLCPGRTEVEWGDLAVEFSGGVLDGYRYLDGGLPALGSENPPMGLGVPVLKTAAGATLGMTLAQAEQLYPASDFTTAQGGAIEVAGVKAGDRLFLGFFENTPTTPLTEIKGGDSCGDA